MYLSRILIRWYRSFNTLSLDRSGTDSLRDAGWNKISTESFPFVCIQLDPRITTIVGANEAGKSHVLAAISKSFRGVVPGSKGKDQDYARQDLCRYCGFDQLEKKHWPQFVIELTASTEDDKKQLGSLAGSGGSADRLWFLINGEKMDSYAISYQSESAPAGRTLKKDEWFGLVGKGLPEVRYIAADKALADEVHIKQLIDLYNNNAPSAVYDPVKLQEMADELLGFRITPGTAPDAAALAKYDKLSSVLKKMTIGPTENGQLETLLFRDVLDVKLDTLNEINSLASSDQQFIYRIVADIQRRADERLDLGRVWQQDPDLRLVVEYEKGLFFLRITDKTGIKYSFDERSSGLKFFLSYYIQALALEQVSSKHGLIILMDEPDGFLSAAGQRNLLNIFENLIDPRRTKTVTQLIYTTHSPFLINKNFPHRVRLVRKGDGVEGTQVVDRSAYRRFEPIRTALGIDYADTLFVGSQNVVVEGPADQRLFTAGLQKFGRDIPIDSLLDLNRVVFVTAGGTSRMKRVIARSLGGTDDKLPIVVAVFDGDVAGSQAYQEILQSGLLQKHNLITLDGIGAVNAHVRSVRVLEDLVPASLLCEATISYYQNRWNRAVDKDAILIELTATTDENSLADRLKSIWDKDAELKVNVSKQDEFRASIIEELCEMLVEDKLHETTAIEELKQNLVKIYTPLSRSLSLAGAEQSRQNAKKRILYFVREFRRSFVTSCTKANVQRYIDLLRSECTGPGPELKQARDLVEAIQAELDKEAAEANKPVDRDAWVKKLEAFANKPWG